MQEIKGATPQRRSVTWSRDILKVEPTVRFDQGLQCFVAECKGLPPELWGYGRTTSDAKGDCWRRRWNQVRKDEANPWLGSKRQAQPENDRSAENEGQED